MEKTFGQARNVNFATRKSIESRIHEFREKLHEFGRGHES